MHGQCYPWTLVAPLVVLSLKFLESESLVVIMEELCQVLLCPAGSMTILPTVLFLITGVLRETAVKAVDGSVPVPVSAALQGIKTILTSPLAQVESMQTQWTGLVRSSLASVLEYSQPGEKTPKHKFQLWLHRKAERCLFMGVSLLCVVY